MRSGAKSYEESFIIFFISAHIGWQAGTITLCQSQLYPPRQGLRNWPQAGSNLLSDEPGLSVVQGYCTKLPFKTTK